MGSFLFSAKYDRSPSPRREKSAVAGNCPLIRARLSNHPIASAPGFLTAPLARRSLLPINGEYRTRRAISQFFTKIKRQPQPLSPRRERNSGAGNCPLIRARLFDRPSGVPQPSPHQRRIQAAPGDFPVLHENRATAAVPLPAAKETPARGIIRSSARGFRIISQLPSPRFLTVPPARRIFFSAAANTYSAGAICRSMRTRRAFSHFAAHGRAHFVVKRWLFRRLYGILMVFL